MSDMIDRARKFAIEAHGDQKRRYTGEPYWHHCEAVAAMVAAAGADDETVAAAWLHDTIEDCGTRGTHLQEAFSLRVAQMVFDVTKPVSRSASGLRKLEIACPEAQTIKVADIIDNCSTLLNRDAARVPSYFREKRSQLEVLTRADTVLLEHAWGVIGFD